MYSGPSIVRGADGVGVISLKSQRFESFEVAWYVSGVPSAEHAASKKRSTEAPDDVRRDALPRAVVASEEIVGPR